MKFNICKQNPTKESLEQKLVTVNKQYNMTKITAPINGTVDEVIIKSWRNGNSGNGGNQNSAIV